MSQEPDNPRWQSVPDRPTGTILHFRKDGNPRKCYDETHGNLRGERRCVDCLNRIAPSICDVAVRCSTSCQTQKTGGRADIAQRRAERDAVGAPDRSVAIGAFAASCKNARGGRRGNKTPRTCCLLSHRDAGGQRATGRGQAIP